jgi:hypothetical protein
MEQIIKDKQSSVEVSKTSTGKYSWSIKFYFNEEIVKGEEVIKEIERLNELLKQKYGTEQ